jgi:hypothetical protein
MLSVEKIDRAAKARANQRLISYRRIALPVASVLFILLASASEAPPHETQLVKALAATAVVTSVLIWSSWRYKLYGVAIFCFLFAVANVLWNDHPRHGTALGWIAGHFPSFLFTFYGAGMCVIARRYSIVSGNDWKDQRKQLDDWFQNLNSQSGTNVIEFPTGSFWTGYWTYHILNTGDCWLVAKFKRGTTKLAACSVVELKHVVFTGLPSGKWNVEITEKNKTRTFTEVEIARPPGGRPTSPPRG